VQVIPLAPIIIGLRCEARVYGELAGGDAARRMLAPVLRRSASGDSEIR
jgi:hypothetical protein